MLNRRRLLQHLLTGSLFGPFASLMGSATPATAAMRPAASAPQSRHLRIATFPDYHVADMLKEFSQDSGIAIELFEYENNEDLLAELVQGRKPLDLIVVTDYLITPLASLQLIRALDGAAITDLARATLMPRFAPFARIDGQLYAWPKNWGTTGICYRLQHFPQGIGSWAQFWSSLPQAKGHCSVIDDQQTVIGCALQAQQHSYNDTRPAHLLAAEQLLRKARPYLRALQSDATLSLAAGDVLVMAYSDAAYQLSQQDNDIAFRLASDGGELWSDWYAMAYGCQDVEAAYQFLNWISAPEQLARAVEELGVSPVDTRVADLLGESLQQNPLIFPASRDIARLEMASPESLREPLRAEIFSRFKQLF